MNRDRFKCLYEEVAVTWTSQERGMFGHFANWGKYLFLRGRNFAVGYKNLIQNIFF